MVGRAPVANRRLAGSARGKQQFVRPLNSVVRHRSMSRAAITYPEKDQLRQMSVAQLNAYIGELRAALKWRTGPAHKAISKRLEVAEKVRELQRGKEKEPNDV